MKIAQVAPLQVATPPHAYGGTERIIHNLTESLVEMGHEVTLFATGDSQTSARLVPGVAKAIEFDPEIEANAYHIAMLEEVYRHASEFDVIHSHLDYLTFPFIETTDTPTVLTLHGRIDMHEFKRVYSAYADANYVAISESQRQDQPYLNWVATIHHGIDMARFAFSPQMGEYLCFVGRITPEKGPECAIEVAKRAGIPLKIAAKVDPKNRKYFTQVIEPLLDHPLIEFLGQLDEARKCELMRGAMALLLPIHWPEPFGVVFIEALACGTPVLTCPIGSAPELLRDGVTGFLRETTDELVEAVRLLPYISREACRDYAVRRFDRHRMANDYLRVYTQVQKQGSLQAVHAVTTISGSGRATAGRSVSDAIDIIESIDSIESIDTVDAVSANTPGTHAAHPVGSVEAHEPGESVSGEAS
jgi:glycosyltransferase involved in cell wall biosynthesis